MRIVLNGKETEIERPMTAEELLRQMKIPPQMVALEINLKIIKRAEYGAAMIREGDQVEILQMIGGG